ncbi:MAG: MAPEG family protein [Novosphingobium sp.]
MQAQILAPAAVLAGWSLIMLVWLGVSRGAAMRGAGKDLASLPPGGRGQDLEGVVEPRSQWKAHNYSHLMEQPTVFYVVVVILALTGAGALDVLLAWIYVALRIVHSLWQATVNRIPVRFALFLVSTACLMVLAVRAIVATLWQQQAGAA